MAQKPNGANLGFEEKMWQAADKLRGHMDAASINTLFWGWFSSNISLMLLRNAMSSSGS